MNYTPKNRDQHFATDGHPKRILALDGGGLRGILSIAMLQKMETLLKQRHGGDDHFRLAHYFDLIAGTSTGAIIAAALAQGWTVAEIYKKYMQLGETVFEKSLLKQGFLRAKYDDKKLSQELKKVYGPTTRLKDDTLQTGLMVMTKRLDTGSSWPISNNPNGKYYLPQEDGSLGNRDYLLWQVVRASTAAPAYFDPEQLVIVEAPGHIPVTGEFIDGGASPYNNPALQALMYTTMGGYRVNWPMGADQLLLVSLGTGSADPGVKRSNMTVKHAINALLSLMDDCAGMQEVMLQWLSSSPTARHIDGEIGDLQSDLLAGEPKLQYLRYNVSFEPSALQQLNPALTDSKQIASLSEMDAPENMDLLHDLGLRAAERDIDPAHFDPIFDLTR